MNSRISQREARRLKNRVDALERAEQWRRRVWAQEWLHGTEIARVKWENDDHVVPVAVRTARKLNHAVVVVGDDSGLIRFIALPHPKVSE